jgi:hypothetical protein
LLATFAFTLSAANAGINSGYNDPSTTVTENEIADLLDYYSLDEEAVEIDNIYIKIYNGDENLIYSTKVCQKDYECDERLNNFINQSDFITEIDNTRIYILNQ